MPNQFEAGDELKSTDAAAQYVDLSPSTMAKLRCAGGGPEYIKLGRAVRYERAALDRWVASHRVKSTSDAERLPCSLVEARSADQTSSPEPPLPSAPISATSPNQTGPHGASGAAGSPHIGSGRRAEIDSPRRPRRIRRRDVLTKTRP